MLKPILFVSFFLLLISCDNGELTKKKAAKLIEACDSHPFRKDYGRLELGKVNFRYNKKQKETYDELAKAELITITSSGKKSDVTITEKGSKFVSKKDHSSQTGKMITALYGKSKDKYVELAEYAVDQVIEIREIPQFNGAVVKVKFKLINKTPFFILESKKNKESFVRDLEFRKTTDGWKYCKDI
jgi:hypothetical protein